MSKNNLKVVSFFAGAGGIDQAFHDAGFETVYANEFDPYPASVFDLNFNIKTDVRDISSVEAQSLPGCDIIIGGFPCQAFSQSGLRLGFKDPRGRGLLFFEMARIIEEKKPAVVFCENVKGLVGHDEGNTLSVILGVFESLGYHVTYKVLNAKDYGIPQNRERIYITAFRDKSLYDKFEFPDKTGNSGNLSDFIDFDSTDVSEKFFYTKEKFMYYDILNAGVKDQSTVYQWRRTYVRANMNGVSPTLTAAMGTGGHNVPIIRDNNGRIRRLTPRECFNLQGFPGDFCLGDLSDGRLYKMAGNSVAVPVVKLIADNIQNVLDNA